MHTDVQGNAQGTLKGPSSHCVFETVQQMLFNNTDVSSFHYSTSSIDLVLPALHLFFLSSCSSVASSPGLRAVI